MHRRLLAVLSVAVALAGLVAMRPAPATADHSWSTYHWSTATDTLTLSVGDNLTTADWQSHLATTRSEWSTADCTSATTPCADVLELLNAAGQAKGNCRPTAGKVEVCNAKYGQNGWLGLAQIWLSGGHIVQGTAKLNDTYFLMPAYNNWSEKQHVMCQEVGHTFGLGHTSEDGSSQNTCMDYYYNRTHDGISTAPNTHDYEQLTAMYGHAHTATSGSTAPNGAATGAPGITGDLPGPNDPRDFGRAVGPRDQYGRPILFERTLTDGRRLLTWVRWVRPGTPGAP